MGPMAVPSGKRGGTDAKWGQGMSSHHRRGHPQGREEKKGDLRSYPRVNSRVGEAGDQDGKGLGHRRVVAA